MKKLLLLSLLLISLGVKSQQAATANNQQIQIGKEQLILQAIQAQATGASTFQLASTTSSATTSGSVAAGTRALSFETSSDFSGIIDGQRFLGSGFLPYSGGTDGILPAISYTVSAGTLYIRQLK